MIATALRPMSIGEAAASLATAAKGYHRALRSPRISASDALELERRFGILRTTIEAAVVGPGKDINLPAPDADLLTALSAWSEVEIHENVRANKPHSEGSLT